MNLFFVFRRLKISAFLWVHFCSDSSGLIEIIIHFGFLNFLLHLFIISWFHLSVSLFWLNGGNLVWWWNCSYFSVVWKNRSLIIIAVIKFIASCFSNNIWDIKYVFLISFDALLLVGNTFSQDAQLNLLLICFLFKFFKLFLEKCFIKSLNILFKL